MAHKKITHKYKIIVTAVLFSIVTIFSSTGSVLAGTTCGSGDSQTKTSIDFGCTGKGNGITDLTFAIIRFLTNGIGIVVVASMVYAGIQYTTSRGDPSATAKAIARIRSNVFAILLFAFAYALLNFIIPGQVFAK